MKIVHHTPTIWSIENFLSEKACNDLIVFGETLGYTEAALNLATGAKIIKGIRNNSGEKYVLRSDVMYRKI